MSDWAQIRTDGRRLLNAVGDAIQFTDAELLDWGNQWLRYTATWLKYPISEEEQTTVDGTAVYTLTADFLEITDVYWDNAKLFLVDEDFLSTRDLQWRDAGSSDPEYWLREDTAKIRLHPKPNKAKTLLFRLRIVPTAMSADSDTPDLPTSYHDTGQWYIAAMGFYKLREFEKASVHWNKHLALRQDLRSGAAEFSDEANAWIWA